MVISVAVPAPLFKCFDYLPAEGSNPTLYRSGQRVLVPFAGRKLIGIIKNTDVTSTIETTRSNTTKKEIKLKHILHVFNEGAIFSAKQLELLTWASIYYCHPIGDCLHTALPTRLRKYIKPADNAWQKFISIKWLRTNLPYIPKKNAHKQHALIETISDQQQGMWQDALKSMGFSLAQLKSLEKAGYLRTVEYDPLTATAEDNNDKPPTTIQLNPEQLNAVTEIQSSSRKSSVKLFNVSVLQGITGSGKTEVYIECVRTALKSGKQSLILIPEINLSPQTLTRFQSQLNTPIGLIHSGMSAKERLSSWQLAQQGIAKVIIGTRSAIFTPFKELGLIVVDEEHDASYKQIDGFKYSARDLAVKKAQIEGCQIILGSATPSLETLHNVNLGKYQHIKLAQRAGKGKLPDMHLIDIRSRALENGCSRPLLDRIDKEITEGNQVIIFQNRRGFAPTLMCNSCGWIAHCIHCDAKLTLHSRPPHLHCHHCNYKQAMPLCCESCQQPQLSPLGSGTERIEFGLQQRFPNTSIKRIDRDNIRKQADMVKLIEEINLGEPCILVGTQMLAKGHDFHHVTLVAIIDADASFFSADFRAIERSAQLLLQVSGRTGRGEKPGTVLIQTRKADHPLFINLLASDYDSIAQNELEDRTLCELPPYSKMITIRADAKVMSDAIFTLQALSKLLHQQFSEQLSVQISGPIEANMSKKAGIYRCYLHLFISESKIRNKVLALLPEHLLKNNNSKSKLQIDVDPLDYI